MTAFFRGDAFTALRAANIPRKKRDNCRRDPCFQRDKKGLQSSSFSILTISSIIHLYVRIKIVRFKYRFRFIRQDEFQEILCRSRLRFIRLFIDHPCDRIDHVAGQVITDRLQNIQIILAYPYVSE